MLMGIIIHISLEEPLITEAGEGVAATSPLPFQYLQTENLVRLILLLSVHTTHDY